jgi:Fe-S cluster assembly protein SufD
LAEAATASEPDWLLQRRRHGASLASELDLPTQKSKGWEFTDLSGLDLDAFEAAGARVEGLERPAGGPDGKRRADGPQVLPLPEAVERFPDLVRKRFGSIVAAEDPFVARNEAAWRHGLLVYVPAGERLAEPIRLSVAPDDPAGGLAWRTLVVLEEGAEAELWERYVSNGEGDGLLNGVVELSVGTGARLRYVCQQELSERSWVFATQRAEVERDGALDWVALGFGSARGKVRMETKLAGPGSSARVTGAYAGHERQHLDFDTTQEHAAQHTTSDLAFRGVLADRATAVWRGMIRVDPGAQQTDAFQESRNLLLSTDAHADAIPGLEIEANDVRCTHAAAVAQVDRDQLFYLRTHGLDEATAKRLIIEGFMEALVERLAEGPVRDALSGALEQRLALVLGERA